MSDLVYTQVGRNYRKAQGFSNFNSRNVVFYTVYLLPKGPNFVEDYQATPQKPNCEFAQMLQTIAFAGVELFFIGEPAYISGPGYPGFIIGVNTDTSNMGDTEYAPGVFISNNLILALDNAGWPNYVVRMETHYQSIDVPV
jgi:hypothetical protein